MPVNIFMPALSPTMEKGNLAKWLKREGDKVKPGDVIAEIETDKATMEYEAIDEGTLAKIVVPEGTQDVAVNALIAVLAEEGEDVKAAAAAAGRSAAQAKTASSTVPASSFETRPAGAPSPRWGEGAGAPAGFGGVSAAGAGGFGAATGAGAAPLLAPAAAAFTSSPSPASTAISWLTGTSAVPSGTTIFASTPSSAASTSMVALSVSISAMMSPDLTLSPWCLTHLARLPF